MRRMKGIIIYIYHRPAGLNQKSNLFTKPAGRLLYKGDLMKPRFFFLTVSLIAVTLIVSCSPASPTQEINVLPPTTSSIDSAPATEAVVATSEATQVPAVQPVATSRGDNLEATDPSTVSLASGQLQLIEFFRFT